MQNYLSVKQVSLNYKKFTERQQEDSQALKSSKRTFQLEKKNPAKNPNLRQKYNLGL